MNSVSVKTSDSKAEILQQVFKLISGNYIYIISSSNLCINCNCNYTYYDLIPRATA